MIHFKLCPMICKAFKICFRYQRRHKYQSLCFFYILNRWILLLAVQVTECLSQHRYIYIWRVRIKGNWRVFVRNQTTSLFTSTAMQRNFSSCRYSCKQTFSSAKGLFFIVGHLLKNILNFGQIQSSAVFL